MKKYESYKDSGEPWLGKLPNHWDVKRLNSCFDERKEHYSAKEQLIILSVMKDIGVIPYSEKGNVGNTAKTDSTQYKVARKGDLIINSMNVIIGSLGLSDYDGYISPAYYAFCPRQNVYSKYFEYVLKLRSAQSNIRRFAKGIMEIRLKISAKDFLSIPFPIPPLYEQVLMVSYLDSVTSKIDEAIHQQLKMIDLLNERKQIIIQNAVTKGLNPTVKTKDSGVDWIGDIPEDWEVMKLKYICKVTDGTHFSPKTTSEGRKYVTVTNVYDDIIDLKSANFISESDYQLLVKQGCQPQIGDILLAKDGTVGRTAIVNDNNFVALSSLGILHPYDRCTAEFLKIMLDAYGLQEQMKELMAGSALRRITITKISNLTAIVPPINEQLKIIKMVKEKIEPILKDIEIRKKRISLLRERKQIIINDVVTGKVKVS